MARGITYERKNDARGARMLVLRKKHGKFTVLEIGEFLQYEVGGMFNGRYALVINASESTCNGTGWQDEDTPTGDIVELYELNADEACPICGAMLPDKDYCPHCGESLRKEENQVQHIFLVRDENGIEFTITSPEPIERAVASARKLCASAGWTFMGADRRPTDSRPLDAAHPQGKMAK